VTAPAQEPGATAGRRLDGDETFKRIKQFVGQGTSGNFTAAEIELPVQDLAPHAVDANQAKQQITNCLNAPLVLSFEDRSWAIDQATLAGLLTVQPTSNPDGPLSYKANLNSAALRTLQDAGASLVITVDCGISAALLSRFRPSCTAAVSTIILGAAIAWVMVPA